MSAFAPPLRLIGLPAVAADLIRPLMYASGEVAVDYSEHDRGAAFPIGATQIALGGTHLWLNGSSDQVLHTTASGLLSLHLF